MFGSKAKVMRERALAGLGAALLLVALVTAYANHFHNSFHFDDAHTIVNNASIRELRNIPLFFRDATTFSSLPSNQSYRPLVSTLLAIDYRLADIDALAHAGERFDVVLALEIIEHVADRDAFLAALGALVRPGGAFIGATLNRTPRSFALAIVGAEYLLGWLPRGTHDWQRFVRPSEFVLGLRRAGLRTTRLAGLGYDWRRGEWTQSEDLSVNYMLAAVRR